MISSNDKENEKKEPVLDFEISNTNNSLPKTEKAQAEISNNHSESSARVKLEEIKDQAVEFAKNTADEVKTQGQAVWDSVIEKVDELNESTKSLRENIKNKASETLESINQTVDDFIEKEKSIEEKESQVDVNNDGYTDSKIDFGKPVQEAHSDFFQKAEKWLDKNENTTSHVESDNKSQENITPTLELPKE
ncbi:MAG: hypothetical protein IT267_09490 [Saprospiraceae bacterium]|nr:hypothetical protein [Saprospiraceae bacterium]